MMRFVWLLCVILLLPFYHTPAQTDESRPLIFLIDGDLWAWSPVDSQMTQLTQLQYAMYPQISPDGSMIVFSVVSPIEIEAYGNPSFIGTGPTDIWLMDIETFEITPIITQPEGITLVTEASNRTFPAWSPDSTRLAWTEQTGIYIYDIQTSETRQLSDDYLLGASDAGASYLSPIWGSHLAFLYGSTSRENVYVYDDETGASYQYENNHWEYYLEYRINRMDWVLHNDEWWLALWLGQWGEDGVVHLMNPETGERQLLSENPTLQLVNEPENSVRLRRNRVERYWEVVTTDNEVFPIESPNYLMQRPVISPDGQHVAYMIENELFVWSDGSSQKITDTRIDSRHELLTQGITWGAMVWRTNGEATPVDTPEMPFPGG